MGYSPWGHKESDTIERLTLSLFTFFFIAFLRDTIQPIVAPLSKLSIDLLSISSAFGSGLSSSILGKWEELHIALTSSCCSYNKS